MKRYHLLLSMLLNVCLLGGLAYCLFSDPVVADVTTGPGERRVIRAGEVREALAERHAGEVLGDLVGREMVSLATQESSLSIDTKEFEAMWSSWMAEPGVKARLDSGEVTELELRERLTTLVLLDQLSWNDLNLSEQEATMREFFEKNKRSIEQIRVRHILLDSKEDAREVTERLAAGVDFSELARRFSLDPLSREQGGDLGWKTRADFTEDLRAFLFLQTTGLPTNPVSSVHGWHIFLIEERRSTFQECRDLARREWARLRRPATLSDLRSRFEIHTLEGEKLKAALRPVTTQQGPREGSHHELRE